MDKDTAIVKLKEILKPYIRNQEGFDYLDDSTDFINDLKMNSANLVDVVLDVEEAFGIEIDNESMERMLTVKAALEIIESKLGGW